MAYDRYGTKREGMCHERVGDSNYRRYCNQPVKETIEVFRNNYVDVTDTKSLCAKCLGVARAQNTRHNKYKQKEESDRLYREAEQARTSAGVAAKHRVRVTIDVSFEADIVNAYKVKDELNLHSISDVVKYCHDALISVYAERCE